MRNITVNIMFIFFLLHLTACGVGSVESDLNAPEVYVSNSSSDNISSQGATAVITLSWIPPTEYLDNVPMYDLSGYKIYYGTEPAKLELLIDIEPHLATFVIENDDRILVNTTYYFAMRAYSSTLHISPLSNVVMFDGTK